MKYRKKPVVIEATQWFKDGDHPAVKPHLDGCGWVSTLDGLAKVKTRPTK